MSGSASFFTSFHSGAASGSQTVAVFTRSNRIPMTAKLLTQGAAFYLGDCGRGVSTAAARIARIADVADGVSQPLFCKIQARRIGITLNGLDLSARASAS